MGVLENGDRRRGCAPRSCEGRVCEREDGDRCEGREGGEASSADDGDGERACVERSVRATGKMGMGEDVPSNVSGREAIVDELSTDDEIEKLKECG